MKHRTLLIATLLFFLLINTSYFWEMLPGLWDIGIAALLLLYFIILGSALIVQIYYLIKERWENKARITSTGILFAVISSTILFPTGIINFEKLEGRNVMVAYLEGVANCTTTIKLKEKNRFVENAICFGVDKNSGIYEQKGDTIYLKYNHSHDSTLIYGVIHLRASKNSSNLGEFTYYAEGVRPLPFIITKYEMKID